jgi:hypothetical protein
VRYAVWASVPDAKLATFGIAQMSLEAAFGLPGAGEFDLGPPKRQIDDWARIVDHYTTRTYYKRSRHKRLTDSQFRIMTMIGVLQRNLGVTYNRAFSEGEYDARDSRNLMIHGILQGHGGTCVTMPMLYCAIGRRLGYPSNS